MSNVKKYTDKLDQLKFDNMYNGDFFLTWEKTDDEIAAVFVLSAKSFSFSNRVNLSL